MCAVDIGIGHDDNFMIAQLRHVDFLADPRAEGGDHRTDFVVVKNTVQTGFFNV